MSKRYLPNDELGKPAAKVARRDGESDSANSGTRLSIELSAEHKRLATADSSKPWRLWGPYLSERQWGTVREDHSADGSCWEYLSHDDATYRAYESGEDGLLGICDESGELCLALTLWNGHDHILKERLFGLTGLQGNHAEDVKELYYYQDSTPSHSYMQAVYKYPQAKFPYEILIDENSKRGRDDPEFELLDTGVLDKGCWNITAEYAKSKAQDILGRYTIHNAGAQSATIHFLPTLWYRNTWLNNINKTVTRTKQLRLKTNSSNEVHCTGGSLGTYVFAVDTSLHEAELVFTENETNVEKWQKVNKTQCDERIGSLPGNQSVKSYAKDAFHDYVIKGDKKSVNPRMTGTKCAAVYRLTIQAGSQTTINCRLFRSDVAPVSDEMFGNHFRDVFLLRQRESDEFYKAIIPRSLTTDEELISRQAYSGLCWSKQLFIYNGLKMQRKEGIHSWNPLWKHLRCHDVISMPDKWEFPWFATWDLAFHMVPMCNIDLQFAKSQLLLLLNDRYQHPNGQLPAYEFDFSDVNPPVHAWACLHAYYKDTEEHDTQFLLSCFLKLTINFTWWLNEKDPRGKQMFNAGFLGMDNISCIHRSLPPQGTTLDQVDGSAWMAFYALCLMRMALELAATVTEGKRSYEDMAVTYLGHFTRISQALNDKFTGLWNADDGFFYDRLHIVPDKDDVDGDSPRSYVLRIRSLVGLSTMFATCVIPEHLLQQVPTFAQQLADDVTSRHQTSVDGGGGIMLSLISKQQLQSLMRYLLDEDEFMSPFGIRSLSKFHEKNEFSITLNGETHSIGYCPGESNSSMFGGNSNWRGPVWLCMNYLLLEALDVYSMAAYDDILVDLLPNQRDASMTSVAQEVRRRLVSVFAIDEATQERPVNRGNSDSGNSVLFPEYINSETGRGCGASHQTGWTALIANILQQIGSSQHK